MSSELIKFQSILHATDFSEDSEGAFAHALKAAVDERSSLTIIHVSKPCDESDHWESFPSVRSLLARWGLLSEGEERAAVYEKLGVEVEKIEADGDSVSEAVAAYIEDHPVDLLVLATHGRHGLPRWFHRSVAEPIARNVKIPVLFVPRHQQGFVSTADGSVDLLRVLLPINHEPNPFWAPRFTEAILHAFDVNEAEVTLLHVGSERDVPVVTPSENQRWTWKTVVKPGKPVDEILAFARQTDVDLIVMTTEGHHGFLDALRGSTTEQVLRHADCPVLMIPSL
jgi:nucleotide-binding universal stress UspA family protein